MHQQTSRQCTNRCHCVVHIHTMYGLHPAQIMLMFTGTHTWSKACNYCSPSYRELGFRPTKHDTYRYVSRELVCPVTPLNPLDLFSIMAFSAQLLTCIQTSNTVAHCPVCGSIHPLVQQNVAVSAQISQLQ